MYGKIFKYQLDEATNTINVFLSFGGLLLSINGDYKNLKNLEIDARVYLLMKAI